MLFNKTRQYNIQICILYCLILLNSFLFLTLFVSNLILSIEVIGVRPQIMFTIHQMLNDYTLCHQSENKHKRTTCLCQISSTKAISIALSVGHSYKSMEMWLIVIKNVYLQTSDYILLQYIKILMLCVHAYKTLESGLCHEVRMLQ